MVLASGIPRLGSPVTASSCATAATSPTHSISGDSPLAIQSTELVVHEAGSRSAELIFGSLDGLFSVLGIIAAAGEAQLLASQIFTTGLGGAVAGALSVFAATYMSETTEKRTRLLEALDQTNRQRARRVADDGRRQARLTPDHPKVHRLLGRINRRAVLSAVVTSFTSAVSSLALLLPLLLLPPSYAVNAAMGVGILLLLVLGASRGVILKQPAVRSGLKMVFLGILVILASKYLRAYVLRLITQASWMPFP